MQKTLEELLAHFGAIMHQGGSDLKHLHIWSDGCGGQFKNRYQLLWLTEMVSRTNLMTAGVDPVPLQLESVRHSFFASCHGKGPCDALGATCKTLLRNAEVKEKRYLNDAHDAFCYLVETATIKEAPGETRFPRSFVYFPAEEVPTVRPETGPVKGLKSKHSFVASRAEPQHVAMNLLSCSCDACWSLNYAECTSLAANERPQVERKFMVRDGQSAREARDARQAAMHKATSVLKECSVGDLVLVYVPAEDRTTEENQHPEPNWNCQGAFRLAQIAELPENLGRAKRRGRQPARRGKDKPGFSVFYALELEKELCYELGRETCLTSRGEAKDWMQCGLRDGCQHKHYTEVPFERVLQKVGTEDFGLESAEEVEVSEGETQVDWVSLDEEEIASARETIRELHDRFPAYFHL